MSDNFKDSIKQNINSKSKNEKSYVHNNITNDNKKVTEQSNINNKFILSKKKADKTNKKPFNVYMESDLVKKIDGLCKKSGYSRNELINIMCGWCINNLDFRD